MANTVTPSDDTIDSRDVIERITELRELLDEIGREYVDDLIRELDALESLAKEGERASEDWVYGATLVRDSYFREYAKELAEDVGAIDLSATRGWPLNCIDWEAAASELQCDYIDVDFNGVCYWVR